MIFVLQNLFQKILKRFLYYKINFVLQKYPAIYGSISAISLH